MKMYEIQSKNETMTNVSVSVRNKIIGVLVEKVTCGILVYGIASSIRQ